MAAKQLQLAAAMKTEMRQILEAMSPTQKLRAAERLYQSAWQLKAAALRAEHPDWTDEAIRRAVREIFLYARS
jgi:Rv0078B-related antitoxin